MIRFYNLIRLEVRQTEIRLWMLITFLTLAAVWDISLRRVPNFLVLSGWLLGLALSGEIIYFLHSLIPVLVLYPLWRRRMFGGGDIKLLAVLFGWLGVGPGLLCFFYSLLFAGGVGFARLLFHRSVILRFSYFFRYWKSGAARQGKPYRGEARKAAEVPFAAALLAGTLVYQMGQISF